jgi:serine/threonine protein kinase
MVSDEGKALIKKLLVNDPIKRLSAKDALKDPWF